MIADSEENACGVREQHIVDVAQIIKNDVSESSTSKGSIGIEEYHC
jgi:hypothetical protein